MAVHVRQPWYLSYGNIGVDFVNTRWNRLKPHPVESLCQIQDVLDWLQCKRLLNEARQQQWSRQFAAAPSTGPRVLQKALQLREALYNIFWSMANHCPPQGSDVEAVNDLVIAVVTSPPTLQVRPDGGCPGISIQAHANSGAVEPHCQQCCHALERGDLSACVAVATRRAARFFDHTRTSNGAGAICSPAAVW
jgi:hypothetical protein